MNNQITKLIAVAFMVLVLAGCDYVQMVMVRAGLKYDELYNPAYSKRMNDAGKFPTWEGPAPVWVQITGSGNGDCVVEAGVGGLNEFTESLGARPRRAITLGTNAFCVSNGHHSVLAIYYPNSKEYAIYNWNVNTGKGGNREYMNNTIDDRYMEMQIVDWMSGVGAFLKNETFLVRGAWNMLKDTRLDVVRAMPKNSMGRELRYDPKGYHAWVAQLNEQYREAK